jgi:hypothetical protein
MEKVCRKLGSGLTDSLKRRTTSTLIAPPRQFLLGLEQLQLGRKPFFACSSLMVHHFFLFSLILTVNQ